MSVRSGTGTIMQNRLKRGVECTFEGLVFLYLDLQEPGDEPGFHQNPGARLYTAGDTQKRKEHIQAGYNPIEESLINHFSGWRPGW